ncbi:N-acetylmuramoyl-L-alanine amidase [Bacillus thuringiensis]|uniref:N-acetylmuramoyl-L-alanine amidase n=1 Tax=Bacillus thuringiensis TaxID=1428 RepID=UPI000BFC2619|nr:N-acetylmuramoyl-L-alanine amidase [Bacillus thuringiensis]PGM38488.1 N-acetylmuramoyl-L-alanine amidase [Bacillus thuringiensis]
MKVSSHGGHNSIVQGANSGGRKEHLMDREVHRAFVSKLQALGHDVKDDTDEVGTTASMIVNNQVRNINSRKNDVGFSWHLNASNGQGHGVEVLCYSDKEASTAARISAEIAKRTGWKDRGAKIRPDLGVIRSTNCPVFLVECGFIDNESDMAKWNSDAIADAVIYAYFGQSSQKTPSKEISPQAPQISEGKWTLKTGGVGIGEAQEIMNKLSEFNTKGSLVYEGDGIFYVTSEPVEDRNKLGALYWYLNDYRKWYVELYQV